MKKYSFAWWQQYLPKKNLEWILVEEINSETNGERSMILLIRYTNDRELLFSNHIVFLFSALSPQ